LVNEIILYYDARSKKHQITVFVFLARMVRLFLLLIITYFAYFCNGKDRLVKFHLTVDRIILCAEQHTTV
jgi:hypothetical protein